MYQLVFTAPGHRREALHDDRGEVVGGLPRAAQAAFIESL
jgi:hypothetical protein